MTDRNFKFVAERLIGVVLVLVLLRSATAHAGNSFYFLSTVYSYQIVGEKVGLSVASTLPAMQISFALCLIFRWWIRSAYYGLLVLFLGFAVIQSTAIYRGLNISCGCFGVGDNLAIGPSTLAVATACASASSIGFFLSRYDLNYRGESCDVPKIMDSL